MVRGDTDSAPFGTSSGGSVVTFSFGNAVKRAAEDARNRVLELAADHLEASIDDLELAGGKVTVKGNPEASVTLAQLGQMSLRSRSGPIVGRGSFSSEPSATTIAAQIGKVSVDPETGQVRLTEIYNSLDVGKAINPLACEGQMEGRPGAGLRLGADGADALRRGRAQLEPRSAGLPRPDGAGLPGHRDGAGGGADQERAVRGEGDRRAPIAPGVAVMVSAVADAIGAWINEAPMTPGAGAGGARGGLTLRRRPALGDRPHLRGADTKAGG